MEGEWHNSWALCAWRRCGPHPIISTKELSSALLHLEVPVTLRGGASGDVLPHKQEDDDGFNAVHLFSYHSKPARFADPAFSGKVASSCGRD